MYRKKETSRLHQCLLSHLGMGQSEERLQQELYYN